MAKIPRDTRIPVLSAPYKGFMKRVFFNIKAALKEIISELMKMPIYAVKHFLFICVSLSWASFDFPNRKGEYQIRPITIFAAVAINTATAFIPKKYINTFLKDSA
jgi:hypothetical protein